MDLATLYNQVGKPEEAPGLSLRRKFQPWEGGGFDEASSQFQAALETPHNLSESRQLLRCRRQLRFRMGKDAVESPALNHNDG